MTTACSLWEPESLEGARMMPAPSTLTVSSKPPETKQMVSKVRCLLMYYELSNSSGGTNETVGEYIARKFIKCRLTHLLQVQHICIRQLDQHWLRHWLVAYCLRNGSYNGQGGDVLKICAGWTFLPQAVLTPGPLGWRGISVTCFHPSVHSYVSWSACPS